MGDRRSKILRCLKYLLVRKMQPQARLHSSQLPWRSGQKLNLYQMIRSLFPNLPGHGKFTYLCEPLLQTRQSSYWEGQSRVGCLWVRSKEKQSLCFPRIVNENESGKSYRRGRHFLVLLAGSPTFQDESEKLRTKQKALAISK